VKRENVRVLKARRELDLPEEPLGPERVGQVRVEDFERDRPVMPEIVSQVHRSHPAPAELTLDAVVVN
jgi:hypothetical protein